MPKISVIIPVYNVETYLRKCLDSVLAQTISELEVICVDDGSTDASSSILDEYASRDVQIKVIHTENRGYGAAMNTGLDVATGEYLGIVESDDEILPKMYEVLYEKAKKYDLDLVKSDCFFHWESLGYRKYCHEDSLGENYNRVLAESERVLMFRFWMFTWTGIYRRSFLLENQIRWNESPGASFQDNGFWIQTMSLCHRAMWIDEAFYLYRQDNPTSSMKSRDKMLAMVREYDFAENILREKGLEEEVKICNYFRMQENRVTFHRISDELKEEYIKIVRQQYEAYKDKIYDVHGWGETDYVLEWMQKAAANPEDFLIDHLRRKAAVKKQISEAEKLVLYGAGKYAERTFQSLFYHGFVSRVPVVVVSEPKAGQTFFGQPVRGFAEFSTDPTTTLVLAAVGKKLLPEVTESIRAHGYTNFLEAPDYLELYWSM